MKAFRLLRYAPSSGPLQMARDEAVLEAVAEGSAPPTMRIYGWRGRWLSIGMAQSIGDVDLAACHAVGVKVLRRPSGGTAVLHVGQIGWSLALPADHPLAPGDIVTSYELHAELTLELCRRLGIAARAVALDEARAPLPDPVLALACFGALAPHEIVVGGPPRKLVGWGQVRRRGVVLHHAVASLRFDPSALATVLVTDQARLTVALAERVTGFSEAAGHEIGPADVATALLATLRKAGYGLEPGRLSATEERRVRVLVREKYGNDGWTARR